MARKDKNRRPAAVAPRPALDLTGEPLEVWNRLSAEHPGESPDAVLTLAARNGGPGAAAFLAGLAATDGELQEAAIRALPLVGTRAAGDALRAVYDAVAATPLAAVALTGLKALQARGVRVALPEGDAAPTVESQFRLSEIWGSLPDAVGTRQVFARLRDQYGVWRTLVCIWNDRAGLKLAYTLPIAGRDWDRRLQEWNAAGIFTQRVPDDFARAEVEAALRLNAKTGLAVPESHAEWVRHVGPVSEGYVAPDYRTAIAGKTDEEVEELAAHADCLVHESAFRGWALEPADVVRWREELNALCEDDTEKGEEIEALLGQVANELFDETQLALYAERIRDCAIKLGWMRRSHASQVMASIAALLEAGRKPGEIAFFRRMIQNSFAFLEEILADGDDPEALRYDPMEQMHDADDAGEA